MSTLSKIADAVAAKLNAGTFAIPFVAVNRWHLVHPNGAPKDLSVVVMPAKPTNELASRDSRQGRYTVLVVVQKKIIVEQESEIEGLANLVESIDRAIFEADWTDVQGLESLAWMESETDPVVHPEHIEKFRSFTSVVTVTFGLGD